MDKPAFLPSTTGSGPVPPIGPGPEGVNPEFTEGGAPAGRFFTPAELPVTPLGESAGMPATTGGFSPSADHAPLGAPGPAGLDYPRPATGSTR